MVPDDPMSEGKSRASLVRGMPGLTVPGCSGGEWRSTLGAVIGAECYDISDSCQEEQEAESPKPDSSYDHLEEMETCEDRGCPGPPKLLSPKAGTTTKGQAGDGPELTEMPTAPETPGSPETEHNAEMELEKVRMEFELTRLKYVHEENERQRQHEEVMEQLQQQATPHLFSGGLQDLLLPQNQFAMFLYCFIFIHTIYVTKEMVFFLFSKHYLFCIAAILLCLIKTLWSYFQVPCSLHHWESLHYRVLRP
ncbi:transmembrane protein 247 [Talpa occidentalis]|uniref:transmembrane protein 247 n=1 Tax=Talpa occidentalis TaxID=50954 RepID=UPI0023F77DBB|nr:transmembrane protein 247 [Talpa occidentalis]